MTNFRRFTTHGIIILLIVVVASGCTKEVKKDALVERNGLMYEVNSDKPFSGKAVYAYDMTSYKDGKKHGHDIDFSGDSKIWDILYKDGKVQAVKTWYENGQQKYEESRKDNKLHGLKKTWYENGQIEVEAPFNAGNFQGSVKMWYENGQQKSENNFKDDIAHGSSISWYETGQKQYEAEFNLGKINGTYNHWYETGQKQYEAEFNLGKINGTYNHWYETGQKHIEIEKVTGGQFKDEDHTSVLIAMIFFSYDKSVPINSSIVKYGVHGIRKTWYENGQQKSEESYKDGMFHGLKKIWYENGQQKSEESYKDGNLVNSPTKWLPDGTSAEMTVIDGNVYNTITIGNQVWMAENLRVTHYRDGTPIPNVANDAVWGGLTTGAYCYYDNDSTNFNATYGALYNWYAVNGDTDGDGVKDKEIAPEGWHVPTDAEWQALETYLGGASVAGSKLAGNAGLWTNGLLKNHAEFGTSGFTALAGGYRDYTNGSYSSMGTFAYFWSATASSSVLYYSDSTVSRQGWSKGVGFSIRLLRD
jgi:uncharacterized protein (TIGR02145 family)